MTGVKVIAAATTAGMFATAASPMEDWMKIAVEAPLFALLWWTLARTIPQMSSDHKDGLKELAGEMKASGERTNELLEGALRASRENK